jgi:DNA polymerase-3 subunit delta
MDAFKFLERVSRSSIEPVYVLPGDEEFLKRQVVEALGSLLIGDADPAFAWTSIPGETAQWSAVRSELETLPFLSPRRVVHIESADSFVTAFRGELEKYVASPSKSGVLVLEVKSWPANTRLAKLLSDDATVICKSPRSDQIVHWCTSRAQSAHDKRLPAEAANWLVELVGPDLGLLDQEIAKLATYAGSKPEIVRDDVDQLVGRSRAAETFKIFDAIGAGRTANALSILDRLMESGEEPLRVLGAFSWQLMRLARIGGAAAKGESLSAAIDSAGIPPFARAGVQLQVQHLGRRRLAKLYNWLLEADLTMKSTGGLPDRLVLERLIVRLGRPRDE